MQYSPLLCPVWIRSSRVWMKSSLLWMRSSRVWMKALVLVENHSMWKNTRSSTGLEIKKCSKSHGLGRCFDVIIQTLVFLVDFPFWNRKCRNLILWSGDFRGIVWDIACFGQPRGFAKIYKTMRILQHEKTSGAYLNKDTIARFRQPHNFVKYI